MTERDSTLSEAAAVSALRDAMRRVAILGAGGMGTALALLIARSNADVEISLWCRDAEHAGEIARSRVNSTTCRRL